MNKNTLIKKITDKEAGIGVIGMGYVGLPLAVAFSEAGFTVTGIDCNRERVRGINKGVSSIVDVSSEKLREIVRQDLLSATSEYSVIKDLDALIICVPTPLGKTREPDISYIISAVDSVIKNRRKTRKQLIVLESTTYPGTTDEVLLPKLEEGGYRIDRDFYLAFSPERVDPSNKVFTTCNIPKVVGGVTTESSEMVGLLYSQIMREVVTVSSSRVAEMAKLLENTYRSVNIGLANEMALMCEKMNVDVWEVIEAAKTKPFGFMAFYPGPGIGGHCINIDPLYLSWKAKLFGFRTRFITLADQINSGMPAYVVERILSALSKRKRPVKNADILVLGVAYKKDVNDIRESPSLEILELLKEEEADISYSDPYVPEIDVCGKRLKSVKLNGGTLRKRDCVILATDHTAFDYKMIAREARFIFDTRNAFRKFRKGNKKIEKL